MSAWLLIEHSADFSFPSDHATATSAIAARFWPGGLRGRGFVFLIGAIIVSASRAMWELTPKTTFSVGPARAFSLHFLCAPLPEGHTLRSLSHQDILNFIVRRGGSDLR
jgi:hypothetical protein